jgi:hypothetical protein
MFANDYVAPALCDRGRVVLNTLGGPVGSVEGIVTTQHAVTTDTRDGENETAPEEVF